MDRKRQRDRRLRLPLMHHAIFTCQLWNVTSVTLRLARPDYPLSDDTTMLPFIGESLRGARYLSELHLEGEGYTPGDATFFLSVNSMRHYDALQLDNIVAFLRACGMRLRVFDVRGAVGLSHPVWTLLRNASEFESHCPNLRVISVSGIRGMQPQHVSAYDRGNKIAECCRKSLFSRLRHLETLRVSSS